MLRNDHEKNKYTQMNSNNTLILPIWFEKHTSNDTGIPIATTLVNEDSYLAKDKWKVVGEIYDPDTWLIENTIIENVA